MNKRSNLVAEVDSYQNRVIEILPLIAKSIGVGINDLCFCGSGLHFGDCCNKKDSDGVLFAKKAFSEILLYSKSQKGIIFIPPKLWYDFESRSLNRLKCAFPGCNEQTTSCHSIPENVLRKHFGSFCLATQLGSGRIANEYVRKGVGEAGAELVFCNKHDSEIFRDIESLEVDPEDKEQSFLLAFKAIAFAYRNSQKLLGISQQAALFDPYLISSNDKIPKGSNVTISFPDLKNNYTPFKILHDILEESVHIYHERKYDDFLYFYRAIGSDQKIFFSGIANPLHDLRGKRINDIHTPINLTLNIFPNNGKLHVFLACPPQSKKYYGNFFQQLEQIDPKSFIHAINRIIKGSAERPLLPLDFDLTGIDKKGLKNFISTDIS